MGMTTRTLVSLTAALLGGCIVTPGGSSGYGPTDDGGTTRPPADTRPATERACPTGARLRVQLWDVYAMPRMANGDPWDGVTSGTRALLCNASAALLTRALRDALKGQLPGSGTLFDQFVRERIQSTIADQCGLGLNWLQERYEGPDMFAQGAESNVMRWQTLAVQDRYQASLRTTTTGAPAEWTMPCNSGGTQSALTVIDEDVAFDDTMGTARFSLAQLTPQMICGGWVLLTPFEGVASTVLRVQVDGAGQNCDGLQPTMMEEVTLPDAPAPTPFAPDGNAARNMSGP